MGKVILDSVTANNKLAAERKAYNKYPDARTIKVRIIRKSTLKKSGRYSLTVFYGD